MAEFWMIEPEMAFHDLDAVMDLGEEFIRYLVAYALDRCREDLGLFARFVDPSLLATLDRSSLRFFLYLFDYSGKGGTMWCIVYPCL
jgi:aspartyl/asparaginyl-tRNA synthetase